jgi:uncharacterized protein YukJ
VQAGNQFYRISVNVKSQQYPSELLYLAKSNFKHPILAKLENLPAGFTSLQDYRGPGAENLDYIRGNLFDQVKMQPVPTKLPGPENDLCDFLDHYVQRAIADQAAFVYAFGERWGPEKIRDKIFHFRPGQGMHDIHMNQGNTERRFQGDNGVWQDGGLFFHFSEADQWVAIFLAFQQQVWHTDDRTGDPLELEIRPKSGRHERFRNLARDHQVKIVAALVNPGAIVPPYQSVTLLNTTHHKMNLKGWAIANSDKTRFYLSGSIGPGRTRTITLPQELVLSNEGGIITLLDNHDLKVDGAYYTQKQAAREGHTIVF